MCAWLQAETGGPERVEQSERDALQRTTMDLRANLADAQGRCARLLASLHERVPTLAATAVAALPGSAGETASLGVMRASIFGDTCICLTGQ